MIMDNEYTTFETFSLPLCVYADSSGFALKCRVLSFSGRSQLGTNPSQLINSNNLSKDAPPPSNLHN
jgi:hypothetical protein